MNDLINSLINNIGPGRMASTAYDTAWVGRLIHLDPTLGHQALDWISSNQLPDGSWGAAAPMHYHDRVISTLAALITLTKFGRRTRDRKRVERGVRALGEIVIGASRGLMANPLSATIGYEMIIPTLVAEAETLGLIQQQSEKILRRLSHLRSRKIAKIQGSEAARLVERIRQEVAA
jgi:halimadienyl-diphosphate synthase